MEEWLKSISLDHHIAAFRRHHIAFEDFATLTDENLREIGLTIGERRRFAQALAVGRESGVSVPHQTRTLPERRPLTVAFIDLVGSAALAERLDIEDFLEVIRLYRELSVTAISRFGGSVARFIGDGILAYFSYPIANENDPERAIRACLEITRSVGDLKTPAATPLQVRVGVATGRVIVSDLLAGGLADAQSIVGSTPNLAARLQTLAPPNAVMIAETTHQRTEAIFECQDDGAQELRGFNAPQPIHRVLRERPVSTVSFERAPTRLTPVFGRDPESALLEDRWQCLGLKGGGLVAIIGDAGMGKSRLVERFLIARRSETVRIACINASAFDQDSPLRSVLNYFSVLAKLETDDGPQEKLQKLRGVLRGSVEDRDSALPVLAELFGLPGADASGQNMPPAQLKSRTLASIADQLMFDDENRPLCLVVEDAHWLDPTSRELIAHLSMSIQDRCALIVLTTRADPTVVDWLRTMPDVVDIRLKGLSEFEVFRMLQSMFGDDPVPSDVARQIARKTDGVPLYIEELVRPLIDTGSTMDWSQLAFDDTGPITVPAALHEAFMARLDRTGGAKELAQTIAVVGRLARKDILASVAALPAAELDHSLDALVRTGVLQLGDVAGQSAYAFSHALVRDAAYDSLLRDRRRDLHERVAQAIELMDPDAAQAQPELLAFHFSEAGLNQAAIPYWLEAARLSLARSALLEATRLLQRGLLALASLPSTEENLERRVEFVALLGPALIALRGPGSAEARKLYGDAYEICLKLPERRQHFPIYWGWWRMARNCGVMKARADALLRRAHKRADPGLLLQAHHCNWASHYDAGNLRLCCEHIEAGMAIYEAGDYRDHAVLYGNHDAKVCAHGELAQVYWMQGKLARAMDEARRSREWAVRIDHVGSTIHALDMALLHQVYRRDDRAVMTLADEFVRFASDNGFADHRAKGMIFMGWAIAMQGDITTGLKQIEAGLARQEDIGTSEDFPIYQCLRAEVRLASKKPDVAVNELRGAIRDFNAMGLRIWLPEVWRTLGDLLVAAAPENLADAEGAYAEASRIAGEQQVDMLKLRIATSRAKLAILQGRRGAMLDQLVTARQSIVEDDNGGDLRTADALIAQMRNGTALTGSKGRP